MDLSAVRQYAVPLAKAAGTIGALMYGLAPLVVKATFFLATGKRHRQLGIDESLPPAVSQTFADATHQLVACGFRALAHLHNDSQLAGTKDSFVSIWVNEPQGDVAHVIAVRAPGMAGKEICNHLVSYRREFSDGSQIVTSNMASAGVFPRPAAIDSIVCGGVEDLAALYDFHRARAARDQGLRRPRLPGDGQAVDYLLCSTANDMARCASAGYVTWDPLRDGYRATFKGAYLMTWRLLWPVKQFRFWSRNRRADRTLREFGYKGLSALRASRTSLPPPGRRPMPFRDGPGV